MDAVTTRPPKGYAWGAATIQRWALVGDARVVTPASVPALIHEAGYLCLHKPVVEGYGLWTVTHIPSGRQIATLPTQAAARQCIGCLLSLPSLRDETPPPSLRSEVAAIVSSLPSPSTPPAASKRRPQPSGNPPAAPSSFSPVFRGYVPTPADRAAANTAALAFGELWNGAGDRSSFATLEQGAAIHGREEIVVRVTQPPRALLLETDIPTTTTLSSSSGFSTNVTTGQGSTRSPRPGGDTATPGPSAPCLRDGTPATPGEFRRRYQQLLALGDRLRAGSLKFQTLYREGAAEGWTVERLDRWEAIDGKFVSLVQEAWMIWSGAAFCFDCAPEAFKRNVVAKLGFIGSREKGWHELGIKTFLRHPEVAEAQPLRREMREKIGARL
jgi:hypothetical protein